MERSVNTLSFRLCPELIFHPVFLRRKRLSDTDSLSGTCMADAASLSGVNRPLLPAIKAEGRDARTQGATLTALCASAACRPSSASLQFFC